MLAYPPTFPFLTMSSESYIKIPHSRLFQDDDAIDVFLMSFKIFSKMTHRGYLFYRNEPKKEHLIVTIPGREFLVKLRDQVRKQCFLQFQYNGERKREFLLEILDKAIARLDFPESSD